MEHFRERSETLLGEGMTMRRTGSVSDPVLGVSEDSLDRFQFRVGESYALSHRIEVGDDERAYGVVAPDLPGCFSAGDTLDEAIVNAEEAILLYLEDAVDEGKAPPAPSRLAELQGKKEFRGWTWAVVDVDVAKLSTKAVRLNITLPDRLLNTIDSYAKKRGETRPGFLARAAIEALSRDAA